MNQDVRIYPDLNTLSGAVAKGIADVIETAGKGTKKVAVALAGGNTPRTTYRLLASQYGRKLPWHNTEFFWSDERYVPHDHPASNYRMARETLFSGIEIPEENIHPMPTHFPDPEQAAWSYEEELRRFYPGAWPRFDLLLLGMGTDGHVASLFPASDALEEKVRWLAASAAPSEPRQRLSLTLPALNHASIIYVLIAGAEKARTVANVLAAPPTNGKLPAVLLQPREGQLIWWLDSTAAGQLSSGRTAESCPH